MSFVLGSCAVMTGCWDETDVNTVAPVSAIQIDSSNDNLTIVHVQFPASTGNSRSGGSTTDKREIIISGTGVSFQQALEDSEHRSSRKLFYAQNMLLLFSENYARNHGILDVLEFVERSPFFRENQTVAITNTSPDKLLGTPSATEYMNAYHLRRLIENSHKVPKSDETNVMNDLLGPSETCLLPWLTSKTSEPSLNGVGVIVKGKLFQHLNTQDADDLLWILRQRKNEWVRFVSSQVERTALVISSAPTATFDNRSHRVTIQIRGFAQLSQLQEGDKLTPELTHTLNMQINQEISCRAKRVIDGLQSEGLDAIDAGSIVQAKNMRLWQDWKGNWPDRFSHMDIRVDSLIRIVRNGMVKNYPFDYLENDKQGLSD